MDMGNISVCHLLVGKNVLSMRTAICINIMHVVSNLPEGLLASSVPYLKLDLLAINSDHASPKLHTNSKIVYWLKSFVCKLQQQTRFANT